MSSTSHYQKDEGFKILENSGNVRRMSEQFNSLADVMTKRAKQAEDLARKSFLQQQREQENMELLQK